jgi:hypothetical protein
LYVRIPKTINGQFLTFEGVSARGAELSARLRGLTGLSAYEVEGMFGRVPATAPRSLLGALAFAMREEARLRSRRSHARSFLRARGVPPEVHREAIALGTENARSYHQALLLRPFQRLFGYWHVFHLPLAILMFTILAVHIGVAVVFGYTWFF